MAGLGLVFPLCSLYTLRPDTSHEVRTLPDGVEMNTQPDKKAYSVETFCDAYGLRKSKVYQEIKSGRLQAVMFGTRKLIPLEAADRWLKNLPTANGAMK
jgi:excisionase family DNA binding protein